MSDYLELKFTDVGKQSLFNVKDGAIGFQIDRIELSETGLNMQSVPGITRLQDVTKTQNILPDSSFVIDRTLHIGIEVKVAQSRAFKSLGVYSDKGVLIAACGVQTGDLFKVDPDTPLTINLILLLDGDLKPRYEIKINPEAAITKAMLSKHLNAPFPHPHPQYFDQSILQEYADLMKVLMMQYLHAGCWIGTDNPEFNPASMLFNTLSVHTKWELRRYIPEGVHLDGEIGNIRNIGSTGTAHKVSTTYIWLRLPDDYEAPQYMLSVDKTSVNEGQSIILTLQTTVPEGTKVPWVITGVQVSDISLSALKGDFIVGANGQASLVIGILADQKTEGRETLKFSLSNEPSHFVEVVVNDTSRPVVTPSFGMGILSTYVNTNMRYFIVCLTWDGMASHIGTRAEIRLSGSLLPYMKEYPSHEVPRWDNQDALPNAKSVYSTVIDTSSIVFFRDLMEIKVIDAVPKGVPLTITAELYWGGKLQRTQSYTHTY